MRRIAILSTVFVAATASGCMTVAPLAAPILARSGAGYTYTGGRASQAFATPSSELEETVLAAMDDLRIRAERRTHDGGTMGIEGTTADNRRASIALRPEGASTLVSVRIGWFGDEPLSKALLDRVGIRLGTLPPTPAPAEPPSAPSPNPYFSREAIPDSTMLRDQADIYRDSPVPN